MKRILTPTQRADFLEAINIYLEDLYEDDYEEVTSLKELLTGTKVELGYSEEKGHDESVMYDLAENEYEYYIDGKMMIFERSNFEQFLEDLRSASWEDFIRPCTDYLCEMYEEVEDRAMEIMGTPFLEVGKGTDGSKYFVSGFYGGKEGGHDFFKYNVNDIEELGALR